MFISFHLTRLCRVLRERMVLHNLMSQPVRRSEFSVIELPLLIQVQEALASLSLLITVLYKERSLIFTKII